MYESPLTLNEWKIEANSLDQAIKDTAESVGEKFDRYVLHVISETGITVDRDELIKALRYDRDQYNKGYHEGMERGIEISSPTWVSAAKRLPEENGFYLCLYEAKQPGGIAMDEGISILQYLDNKWHLNEIYTVTHWMPLPEPPKEDIDNG